MVPFSRYDFRQLLDPTTCTLTYLIGDSSTKEAILIDSVFEQHLRDLALVRELGLTLRYTLETHVHADHVTGAVEKSRPAVKSSSRNPVEQKGRSLRQHGDTLQFGSHEVQVRETPGHMGGCVTYVMP